MTRTTLVAFTAILAGCHTPARLPSSSSSLTSSVPAWRRGATCYEIFVRSFYDSNGDGIGDLRGLTAKLDYINDGNPATTRDLGARCIWLMPVTESPSYHGYDATNYYRVEPDYGTNEDFKQLVAEAHRRGIAVLVDMVLNHLSSEHPFFKEALGGATAPHRDWFRWSATKPDERGPWGQEVWHKSPVHDEYYYGTFWVGMPDLNYETPAVREEAKKIATFWLAEMGVDGFRLDAVPYLMEEGTEKIGAPGTHAFLREYSAYVRKIAPEVFTVGEVWDGIDRMLPYYPDQLESYFAFDLADALMATARTSSVGDLLDRYARFEREIPNGRYSTFLRNHDQTRTLTALGGELARAKVAASLLLTLPGLPFVYYGEEIAMIGDKPDERLRTPMQWSTEANAGFTSHTPWEPLQQSWPLVSVAAQDREPNSLLNVYRRLIQLRARNAALGGGDLVPFRASSAAIAAYLRRAGDQIVLVVVNLGEQPLSGMAIESPPASLAPGSYTSVDLLGDNPAAALTVDADGRIRGYVPFPTLARFEAHVVQLSKLP